jgi:hypothetical protein
LASSDAASLSTAIISPATVHALTISWESLNWLTCCLLFGWCWSRYFLMWVAGRLATERRREGQVRLNWVWGEHPTRCCFGCPLRSSSSATPWPACSRPSWRDVVSISLSPPAGSCSTPESKIRPPSPGSPNTTYSGRLLVVGPDMAKILAVETLGEGGLGFVCKSGRS